jgi:hypothetical protein
MNRSFVWLLAITIAGSSSLIGCSRTAPQAEEKKEGKSEENQLPVVTPSASQSAPSPYSMALAFEEAKAFTGGAGWQPQNPIQEELVRDFLPLAGEARKISKKVLEAKASNDSGELTKFLRERGLSITLNPFAKGEWGAASVLSLEGKWAGQREQTKVAGKTYPAVRLKAMFWKAAGQKDPVVRLYRDDERALTVYVCEWNGDPTGFAALKKAREFTPGPKTERLPIEEVIVPMVYLDKTNEMTWLVGLSTGTSTIRRAVSQGIVALDEKGFRVREGFAFETTRGASSTWVIDQPFLFWVTLDGLTWPLYVVMVQREDWKDPNAK